MVMGKEISGTPTNGVQVQHLYSHCLRQARKTHDIFNLPKKGSLGTMERRLDRPLNPDSAFAQPPFFKSLDRLASTTAGSTREVPIRHATARTTPAPHFQCHITEGVNLRVAVRNLNSGTGRCQRIAS